MACPLLNTCGCPRPGLSGSAGTVVVVVEVVVVVGGSVVVVVVGGSVVVVVVDGSVVVVVGAAVVVVLGCVVEVVDVDEPGWDVVVEGRVVEVDGEVVVETPTTTVVGGDDGGGKVGRGEKPGDNVVVVVRNGPPIVVVVGSPANSPTSKVVVVSNKPKPTPAPPGLCATGSSRAAASASQPMPDTTTKMSPPARATMKAPATALAPRNLIRLETPGSAWPWWARRSATRRARSSGSIRPGRPLGEVNRQMPFSSRRARSTGSPAGNGNARRKVPVSPTKALANDPPVFSAADTGTCSPPFPRRSQPPGSAGSRRSAGRFALAVSIVLRDRRS